MTTNPPQQDLYPDQPREDVRPWIPREATSALDVGCGAGGFGRTLREVLGDHARIVGVEAVPSQAARAGEGHGFDAVATGYFPEALLSSPETFDLVCFNDVLEHILDPWTLLADTREWLTPRGRVLAAIPSIQFAPVVLELLRGRWDYHDGGTLDRTHVRFFTRATMVEMFEKAGYRVETCEGANDIKEDWDRDPRRLRRAIRRPAVRLLGDARFMHFVVVARPR